MVHVLLQVSPIGTDLSLSIDIITIHSKLTCHIDHCYNFSQVHETFVRCQESKKYLGHKLSQSISHLNFPLKHGNHANFSM